MAREAQGRPAITSAAVTLTLALLLVLVAAWGPGLASDADPLTRAAVGDLLLADDDEGARDGVSATFVAEGLAPGDRHTARLTLSTQGAAVDDLPETPRRTVDDRRVDLRFLATGDAGSPMADAVVVDELGYGTTDLLDRVQAACGSPVTLALLLGCASRSDGPLADLDPPGRGRELVLTVHLAPWAGNDLQGQAIGFDVEATLHASRLDPADRPLGPLPPSTDQHRGDRPDHLGGDPSQARGDDRSSTPERPSHVPAAPGLGPGPGLSITADGHQPPPWPQLMPRTSVARLLVQEEPFLDMVLVPHLFDGMDPGPSNGGSAG